MVENNGSELQLYWRCFDCWESKTLLQEMLSEFGCTVINYKDSKIMVDFL